MLDQHNLYRCMHGLDNLTWDTGVAAKAQAFADKGNYAHSSNEERQNDGVNCGENLAWGYPHLHADTAAKDWYQEIQFTAPYGKVTGMDDSKPVGKPIGHYTQTVWRGSTKIGCGKGPANVKGNTGDMWVCQYCHAGNSAGKFEQNVPAPIKSPAQCGGSNADVPSNFPTDLLAATPAPTPSPPTPAPPPTPVPTQGVVPTSAPPSTAAPSPPAQSGGGLGELSGVKVAGHFDVYGVDMSAFCKDQAALSAVEQGIAERCQVPAAYVDAWCPGAPAPTGRRLEAESGSPARQLSNTDIRYSIQVPSGTDANAVKAAIANDQNLGNSINQRLQQSTTFQVTVNGVVATISSLPDSGGSMCNGQACVNGNGAAAGMNNLFEVPHGKVDTKVNGLFVSAGVGLLIFGSLAAAAFSRRGTTEAYVLNGQIPME